MSWDQGRAQTFWGACAETETKPIGGVLLNVSQNHHN